MDIVKHDWPWTQPPQPRTSTKYIIFHHTDGSQNQDTNEIFQEHLDDGWIGIGYHYVVKGDGTVVEGRPRDTIGAHAQGLNYCSIGIAIEGDFQPGDNGNNETPTDAQIASAIDLTKDILNDYPSVEGIGHRDVAQKIGDPSVATACPGDTLYAMLPDIAAKAGLTWSGQ